MTPIIKVVAESDENEFFVYDGDNINGDGGSIYFLYGDKDLSGWAWHASNIIKSDIEIFSNSPNENNLEDLYNKYAPDIPTCYDIERRISFQCFLINELDISNTKVANVFLPTLLDNKGVADHLMKKHKTTIDGLSKNVLTEKTIKNLFDLPNFTNFKKETKTKKSILKP